eukprot:12399765-Karenia_brevis.AAC.1
MAPPVTKPTRECAGLLYSEEKHWLRALLTSRSKRQLSWQRQSCEARSMLQRAMMVLLSCA